MKIAELVQGCNLPQSVTYATMLSFRTLEIDRRGRHLSRTSDPRRHLQTIRHTHSHVRLPGWAI